MASTYIIKLSDLNLVAKVHIPALIDEVRKRRSDLAEASSCVYGAFDADLFHAPAPAFRDAIDAIQDLQTETIRRLEMGADGVETVVRNHVRLEEWIIDLLTSYEDDLSKMKTDY